VSEGSEKTGFTGSWSTRAKVIAAVAGVAVLVLIFVFVFGGGDEDTVAEQQTQSTAEVITEDLVDRETVSGTLEFGDSAELVSQSAGTVTNTAADGDTVKRNGVLWKIDQEPTLLMYGSIPAYRTMAADNSGRDVLQLERNLSKLGYDGFTVDDYYGSGTADAVAQWQSDVGLSDTGVATLGQIIFRPSAVRVSASLAQLGAIVQPGAPILTVTGDERVVSVDLDTADQSLASVKDKVIVTLPDGQEVDGEITSIGTIATDSSSAASGQGQTTATESTIPVTVTLDKPAKAKEWDSAPVDVDLEAGRADAVLTVPVTALLALAEGGYAVEVVQDGNRQLVAVTTGMFANGRVEVSGNGISEGVIVVVPTT
jgi:peptidoglycan hydrolase-like protein with peptidoglycan-binding domain